MLLTAILKAPLRIVTACRNAMADDALLVLVEAVMPRRARDLPAAIRMDLHMLTLFNGRERTLAELRSLLVAGGFRPQRIVSADGHTGICALEARVAFSPPFSISLVEGAHECA